MLPAYPVFTLSAFPVHVQPCMAMAAGYTTLSSMDALTAILSRRAVRNWTEQEVPQDMLQQILEAGRFAPSPLNSQPWHFTVIRNPATVVSLMESARHGTFLSRANVVVVVTVTKEANVDAWLSEHEQHIFSAACALHTMWIAATSLGLGGCWVTLDDAATRPLLSIPDHHILLGSLALGYPADPVRPHQEKDRLPLASMVSYEAWSDGRTAKVV